MQNVQYGQHRYVDLSHLNAKWAEARPAVAGLGNGVLSGNSLGMVAGLGADPTYPWGESSADTLALQKQLNAALSAQGYLPVTEDGTLGPATCGGLQTMCASVSPPCQPPGTCKSFTAPTSTGGGGGGTKTSLVKSSTASMFGGGGTNWTLIGAGVGLAAVGIAIIYKTKKRGS